MKRLIYTPAVDEIIPDGAYHYILPVSGKDVVDVIVPDNFGTDGEIVHEQNDRGVIATHLPERAVHHFAGWEF